MAEGRRKGEHRHEATQMRSPVNWALLGVIIERPSYAYDLAHRFERRYGTALQVSSVRHIYTAITALKDRGLVEEIPGSREGRQPKPRYRATQEGLAEYEEWLVGHVCKERHREEVFVLALAALAGEQEVLASVLERCERAWLAAGSSTSIGRDRPLQAVAADADGRRPRPPTAAENLIAEESRLAIGAKLAWVQYARRELQSAPRSRR